MYNEYKKDNELTDCSSLEYNCKLGGVYDELYIELEDDNIINVANFKKKKLTIIGVYVGNWFFT